MSRLDQIHLLSVPILAAAVVGYLLGSLPFGYWVGRAHGVNIFELGSKNPGATNVRRVLGKRAGNVVFAADALKGAIAASLPIYLVGLVARWEPAESNASVRELTSLYGTIGLAGALLGHSFSCFSGFKGGKGVATVAGGFLVLMPYATLTSAAVWAMVFYAARYVSLASILAAASLPVAAGVLGASAASVGIATVLSVFIIFRHRGNLARLLKGTENRFERKPGPRSGEDNEGGSSR